MLIEKYVVPFPPLGWRLSRCEFCPSVNCMWSMWRNLGLNCGMRVLGAEADNRNEKIGYKIREGRFREDPTFDCGAIRKSTRCAVRASVPQSRGTLVPWP